MSTSADILLFLTEIQLLTIVLKNLEKLVKANKASIFISKTAKIQAVDTPN
jgi:hypothetical protein